MILLETLLIAALAFGPLAFGCVEPWSLALLEAALFSMPLLASLDREWFAKHPLRANLLAGVLAVIGLALLQRLNPAVTVGPKGLLPFTASAYRTSHALLLWGAFACLIWSAPQAWASPGALRRLAWALVLIGFAVALIGVIQEARGNTLVYGFREVRYGRSPFGPYFNRGHAASMMAMCLLVGLGLCLSYLSRLFGDHALGELPSEFLSRQALLLFLVGFIAFAVWKTQNQGARFAIVGATALVGALAAGRARRRLWPAAGVLALCLAAAASAPRWAGRIHGSSAASVPFRLAMYRGSARMLADFPLWGGGLGAVVSAFAPYKEPIVDGIVDHVHSDWLELLLQEGLVGFGLCALSLLLLARQTYRGWVASPSPERILLVAGMAAAALAFLLHAFVDFSFQIPANAVLFVTLLSAVGAQSWLRERIVASSAAPSSEQKPGWTPRLLLSAACLGFIAMAGRPPVAYYFSARARTAPLEERPLLWRRAFGWDSDPAYLAAAGRAYWELAVAYPQAQDVLLRKAADQYRRALESDPLHPEFRYWEGEILSRLARGEDAKAFLSPP